MKLLPHSLFMLCFFCLLSCVDDGEYNPKDIDDTTYVVSEPSDGSIASGASGEMPQFMRYDSASHRLISGITQQTGIYKRDLIKRIDLNFVSSTWESFLENNADTDVELQATLKYDGVALPYKVGVRYKGTVVTGDSTKRSFSISLDFVKKSQALDGYYTLVLNSGANDSSFIHESIYRQGIQPYIPASQVNYVNLHINNIDYGLYINSEYLNASLIKEWFLSGNGARWRAEPSVTGEGTTAGLYGTGYSGLNYLGDNASDYMPYYKLKNEPDLTNPYENLMIVCQKLNQTAPDSLERIISDVLDLDRTLWFLACENIFTDNDGYIHRGGTDYFLYLDTETGRMTPLEYDGNEAFLENKVYLDPFYHVSDSLYPLLSKLLAVPAIRQRYLAHYRTILKNTYNETYLSDLIDQDVSIIDSAINADPKRKTSYTEFQKAVSLMKTTITQRAAFLTNHDSIATKGLTISNVQWAVNGVSWGTPTATDTVRITASVGGGGVNSVFLCAGTGMVGKFRRLQLYDDGTHGDLIAGDGVYSGLINPQTSGVRVRFYIEAVRGNASRTRSYMPEGAEHDVYSYTVQ